MYPDVVYRLTRLLEKYVSEGRSTPGAPQKNDGNPNIWKSLEIRNEKYETSKVEHLAVGKKTVVKNKVPLSYTNNGIDVLTDGIRASSWYDDGYWVAVEGEDLEIIIDLEQIHNLRKISVGFLEDQNFWIFFPKGIEISLSENGLTFDSLKSISRKNNPNKKRTIKDFSVELEQKKARYIKLKAVGEKTCPKWHKGAGGKAWLFMDEVIVE
ncbi:discoidin domain-containing protein [candidate division KSB1 bacterium]|nr:discoidin domain-containing protein [candidate division KSB1 bacterium]